MRNREGCFEIFVPAELLADPVAEPATVAIFHRR